jgi:hypothetical protein
MDHPCFKCNQPVEDGIPFCTHCRAPQIRVILPEPPVASTPSSEDSSSTQHVPIFANARGPLAPGAGRWSDALRPCALAALVAMILMIVGLYPLVAMVSAGVLSVTFYRYRRPLSVINASTGARLGALGGLVWFGMSAIVAAIVSLTSNGGAELRDEVIKKLQEQAAHSSDPQQMQAIVDYFKTPTGLEVLILATVIVALFSAIIFAGIGGALTGAFLRRKDRP